MDSYAKLAAIGDRAFRSEKPRERGLTLGLDRSEMGARTTEDLMRSVGPFLDFAKIAWASPLVVGDLEAKVEAYRAADVVPMFGGTLFEYAYARSRARELLSVVAELGIAIEVSDGVVDIPAAEKLRWIERFAEVTTVFSELGGKLEPQRLDWVEASKEQIDAGAYKIVIEGREIGPPNAPLRLDLVDELVQRVGLEHLVLEALDRKQQIALVQHLGPDVNLGNVPIRGVMALEAYRLGLKDRTFHQMLRMSLKDGVGANPQEQR